MFNPNPNEYTPASLGLTGAKASDIRHILLRSLSKLTALPNADKPSNVTITNRQLIRGNTIQEIFTVTFDLELDITKLPVVGESDVITPPDEPEPEPNSVTPNSALPTGSVTLRYDLSDLPVPTDIHYGIYVFDVGATQWSPTNKNVIFSDTNQAYSAVFPNDSRTGIRAINLNNLPPGNYKVTFSRGDSATFVREIPFSTSLSGGSSKIIGGFGNSITLGDVASTDATKWLNIVAANRNADFTINEGARGSKLQLDPNRGDAGIQRYTGSILNRGITDLYILYGFNDITGDSGTFTPAQFKTDLTTIVTAAINSGISPLNIYLGTPTMRAAAFYQVPANLTRQQAYNTAVQQVAQQLHTKFADVYLAMVNDGRGDALLFNDGIHPLDAGHAIIAQAFLNAVQL